VFHCCFDLDYILHRGGAQEMARGGVRLPGADRLATASEIAAHAVVLKARGFEVMPTCAKHDKAGHCTGHEEC
jgi:hypothetical protein